MVEIDFQRELLAPTEHLDRYMLHYKNNKYMYVHVLHNSCKGTYMYLRICTPLYDVLMQKILQLTTLMLLTINALL